MKTKLVSLTSSLLIAVMSFAGLNLIEGSSASALGTSTLPMNGTLNQGQSLVSPNGQYSAILQSDGNFVVYGPRGSTWSSGTMNKGAQTLALQGGDGNLVLYRPGGVPVWATGTSSLSPVRLVMQDDGNVVIYNTTQALWSIFTGKVPLQPVIYGVNQPIVSNGGQYQAILQSDGNFVVYRMTNGYTPMWSAGTAGKGANALVVQGDGNVVLYRPGGIAVWSTKTFASSVVNLAMQVDGNLVLYQGSRALWSTGTDIAYEVLQLAISQIGYTTNPSSTDCNVFTWSLGRGSTWGCASQTSAEAWCSDFANWVWKNAGAGYNGLTAYSYSFVTWGQQHGTFKAGPTNNPQPGDAVVWAISPTNSAHIGTVLAVRNDGWIKVISGNDGNGQVGGQNNWFNPTTSRIDGDPIIGYTSPLAYAVAASRGGAPIYTPPVSQAQINAQRPWTPR